MKRFTGREFSNDTNDSRFNLTETTGRIKREDFMHWIKVSVVYLRPWDFHHGSSMLDPGQQRRTVIGMSENGSRIDISPSGSTLVSRLTSLRSSFVDSFAVTPKVFRQYEDATKSKMTAYPRQMANLKLKCNSAILKIAQTMNEIMFVWPIWCHTPQTKLHRIWTAKVTLKFKVGEYNYNLTVYSDPLEKNNGIWREMYIKGFNCNRWIRTIQKPWTLMVGDPH